MLSREAIIEGLKVRLLENPDIRAAWLGGSDANGRSDAASDVDLMLIVAKGRTESAAEAVEQAVESISPIRIRLRLPMPTWHGFEQAFYQLQNAPEDVMIDWLIIEEDQRHPWLEAERHGVPRVLFDRAGVVRSVPADLAACRSSAARKVEELRLKFPLFRHLPIKLARRGLPVDAAYFYQNLVLRAVVDMLRCVHCPQRFDFGFRYVRDDLPPQAYQVLQRLSWLSGPDRVEAAVAEAGTLFHEALAQWDREKTG